MSDLWKEFDGVPYLVNPHLGILANPKRRKKTMAKKKRSGIRMIRDRKGRFVKRTKRRTVAASPRPRRRTVRRRTVAASPRPRRRTARRRNVVSLSPIRRRVYRRNPPGDFKSIFSKDTLEKVGYSALGIWGVPVVAGAVQTVLPLSVMSVIDQNPSLRYVLKGAAAVGMYYAASKFISRKAGEYVLIGGLAYLGLSVVNDLAPAAINPFGMGRYLAKQPLLAGAHGARGVGRYIAPGLKGQITQATASRLDPKNRF